MEWPNSMTPYQPSPCTSANGTPCTTIGFKTTCPPIPLQVDQGVGNLPVEVLLGYQFFGEVVRGQRLGDAIEGEQVGLERGTDRISKTNLI